VAEKSTYVKLDRNLRFWRWFKNPKTVVVWVWLIMSANIEDHDFERETIHRGEVATSRKSISAATGLTEREVRTALEHLKLTGEVSVRIRPKYQVITILRYNDYQDVPSGKTSGSGPADVRQKSGKRPQSKNGKNGKNGKNEKDIYSRPPSVAEVAEYADAEGLTLDADAFVEYNASRGWAGVKDWRPLVRLRAKQLAQGSASDDNDELDEFGRPIRKEFE